MQPIRLIFVLSNVSRIVLLVGERRFICEKKSTVCHGVMCRNDRDRADGFGRRSSDSI